MADYKHIDTSSQLIQVKSVVPQPFSTGLNLTGNH